MAPDCHHCNHPDSLALTAGQSRWGKSTLRYWQEIAYPGVDPGRVARNYAAAVASLAAVCGITIVQASSPAEADIYATTAPIDGPYNVLALSQLPPTSNYVGGLTQTFDISERLDDPTMVAMMAHEFGHILGLGHSAPGTLMAPYLDASITVPQPGDIAELQARYGPPITTQNPSAPAAGSDQGNEVPPPSDSGDVGEYTFEIPVSGLVPLNVSLSANLARPGTLVLSISVEVVSFTPY